jgi:curli production assembly/transport component CsgF
MRNNTLIGAVALALTLAAGAAQADELVYTPVNPSFGGSSFNSAHLLALASAQNQYKPTTPSSGLTQGQIFAQQLQSRLLSALASQVTDAIFGDNPQDHGTITFGEQTIEFIRTADGVTLTITDGAGGQTVITVPTFVTIP